MIDALHAIRLLILWFLGGAAFTFATLMYFVFRSSRKADADLQIGEGWDH